jgi:hypothetical protein
VLNVIGITFIEYTWDANYLCAAESMPSNMRSTSVGSCSMMARLGAIFSPALAYLNTLWPASAYMTVALLGTFNLIVSCAWLVETKGINLDKVTFDDDMGTEFTTRRSKKSQSLEEEKASMLPST